MTDPYHSPEDFGLTIVGDLDDDREPYQFSMFVVWKDADNRLYWADDAGCSCPSPFEDYRSISDLCTGSRAECVRAIVEWVDGDAYFAERAGNLGRAVRELARS